MRWVGWVAHGLDDACAALHLPRLKALPSAHPRALPATHRARQVAGLRCAPAGGARAGGRGCYQKRVRRSSATSQVALLRCTPPLLLPSVQPALLFTRQARRSTPPEGRPKPALPLVCWFARPPPSLPPPEAIPPVCWLHSLPANAAVQPRKPSAAAVGRGGCGPS